MPSALLQLPESLPGVIWENGQVIEDWNLSQPRPNTPILVGFTGLVFRRCMMVNCVPPPGSVLEECQIGNIDYCAHLHPAFVMRGVLDEEPEDCPHVIDIDTVTIDGRLIYAKRLRQDTVL